MAAGDQVQPARNTSPNSNPSSAGGASATSDAALLPPGSKDTAVVIDDAVSIDEELEQQTGWHSQRCTLSLPEAHASITMPAHAASPWRMMLAFAGCGTIISVGYM